MTPKFRGSAGDVDANLRALIERAVAPHLRPDMACEPHPDETAIVDSVMAVVAPLVAARAHPLGAEPTRRGRLERRVA